MQSLDSQNGKNFWKKNSKSVPGGIRAVYGAMHPPIIHSSMSSPKRECTPKKMELNDSFQDFQKSVNDAWDCSDDEFCVISDIKISNKIAQSTALSVINSHQSGHWCNDEYKQIEGDNSDLNRLDDSYAHYTSNPTGLSAFSSLSASLQCKQGEKSGKERIQAKIEKLEELLSSSSTNLSELRELSWSGVPSKLRGITWRILNDYLPSNLDRREETLKRKREEYWNFVKQYYSTRKEELHQDTYRQIHIDIPRMSPLMPLFQQTLVQEMFERILFIWAIRHPASGYVQGINDLVTPFFIVFLQEVLPESTVIDNYELSLIDKRLREIIEADCFWCMAKLLDGIQDNYTFAQPGIQKKVQQLKELMKRIDARLHAHLERHDIDYLQFSFRWFNNLLMRELPLRCTVRLWDTLHAEPDGFSHFLLYVCAAFLKHFSSMLMNQRDFQNLMLLLQNFPTSSWTDSEISILVAEAFRLKYMFADAPNHLQIKRS